MKLVIGVVNCGGSGLEYPRETAVSCLAINNQDNRLTPCQAYQEILSTESSAEVVVFAHDDLTIHDPEWLTRIESVFASRPECVAVGLGGATNLGRPDLYRKPWNIWNMARGGYTSNQTDAEVHGERFTEERRVAVLDAFCMAVRREWLIRRGGWPTAHLTHHCLDLWIACEAARTRGEVWMVGASCTHSGGGSSTKDAYAKAPWLLQGTREQDHRVPHFWLYNEYRDVLPIQVPVEE